MTSSWQSRLGRRSLPSLAALLTLVVTVGAIGLPQPAAHALRDGLQVLLAPGQRGVAHLTEQAAELWAPARAQWRQSRSTDELTRALAAAEQHNRRLRQELSAVRTAWGVHAAEERVPVEPSLLTAHVVRVRVLGRYARAWLDEETFVLDGGTNEHLTAASLVLEDPWPKADPSAPSGGGKSPETGQIPPRDGDGVCLDHATDMGLSTGQLVLSARGVWGQLTRVGPRTSHARSVCDPQSRLLVQTVDARSQPPRLGPQGLWCGAGAGQGRILHVDLTAPVAVGDLVVTAGWEGVLEVPPLVGTITRVTRDASSREWQIEAQAACDTEVPRYLGVLRPQWNSARPSQVASDSRTRAATAVRR